MKKAALFICTVFLFILPVYGDIPIADAGLRGYTDGANRMLDGRGSYDPDNSGSLSYQWTQISGPAVTITGVDTAEPVISGFVQTANMQTCSFELVVNDGADDSLASSVDVIIIPSGPDRNQLNLASPYFDPTRPTVVWFAGGDCVISAAADGGGGFYYAIHPLIDTLAQAWWEAVNLIHFNYAPDGYPETGYPGIYYRCADMLIAYLNEVAPHYDQLIETIGFSTGGQPAMDAGIYLNTFYQDPRYAINRITFTDGACRWYGDEIQTYLDSMAYVNEPGWVANHVTTHGSYYPDTLGIGYSIIEHGLPWHLYYTSILNGELNNYNRGVTAGLYWSVLGPGRNLQLARTGAETYKFKWWGDQDSGYTTFFDGSYTARLPEPITLIEPDQQASILAEGILLTCEVSMNAVGYELLAGPDVWNVNQVISDTPERPIEPVTELPADAKYWTIRARDQYGSTIHADPLALPELIRYSDEAYMAAGAKSIAFYAHLSGASPEDQTVQIHNIGTGSLTWNITEACTWLDVSPVSGTTVDVNDVTLHADISGLDEGSYEYELTVTGSESANSPRNVKVKLYILPASALVVPDDHATIQAAITAASQSDTIIVKPGTYRETIDVGGKDLILRSIDPDDWDIVEWTVIYGNGEASTVTFAGSETADCRLNGFTIAGGWTNAEFGAGGVNANGAEAIVSNCIIKDNTAERGGAIGLIDGEINNCIITGNTATLTGGGISICSADITNCLVYNNEAGYGGGLNQCGGKISNCTIVDNTAEVEGGGLRNCDGAVTNCIIWDNTTAGIPDQISGGSTPSYSCIYDWSGGGSGNIASDPGFVDASNGDFHLKNNSFCINAGDPNGVHTVQTDIDGDLRVFYGQVDIGYDEVFPVTGDIDLDETVEIGDFIIFAEHWLDTNSFEQEIEKEGWWKLDTDAGDSSGNNYNGTVFGNPVWRPGENIDGALEFDGIDDYVAVGSMFAGIVGKDVTVSAWVKAPVVNPATQFVISINTSSGDNRLLCGTPANSATLSLGDTAWHHTTSTVIDNTWHHIAYVLEDISDTITVYVDGSDVLSFTSTVSIAATDLFSLGQEYDPPITTGDFYSGLLDDVRVYDRALDADDILDIYEGTEPSRKICPDIPVGDLNGDCHVDYLDFMIISYQWLWEQ